MIHMVGSHPILIMLGVCLAAMLITQFVENISVTAMFFPIMYQAAIQVGYEPAPFLLALMIAANASYSTPIAASPNIVFGATNLTYISSSGIRVILYCKKYLGDNIEIVFVNCNQDVLDVFDLVGIMPYITFQSNM